MEDEPPEEHYPDDWESPEDWECNNCHWLNFGWLEECEGCGQERTPDAVPVIPDVNEMAGQAALARDITGLIEEIKVLKQQLQEELRQVNHNSPIKQVQRKKKKKQLRELTASLQSSIQMQKSGDEGGKKARPRQGRDAFLPPPAHATPVIQSQAAGSQPQNNGSPSAASSEFSLDAELDRIVGLASVKAGIRTIATMLKAHQRRVQRGLAPSDMTMMCHMLFIGSAGTGKTTVARVVARLLHAIGLLSKGHLMEVSAKDLIAGHCGQTALKTSSVCMQAYGGVLFIDEAYSINPKGESNFGRECVDTLVKEMEDHRDDLVVMMAGYPQSMEKFLETNEGLRSRFNDRFTFVFADYTLVELSQIFLSEMTKRNYILQPGLDGRLGALIEQHTTAEDRRSQNGRLMRTLVENCIANQNSRWVDMDDDDVTDETMMTVLAEDFAAYTWTPSMPPGAPVGNSIGCPAAYPGITPHPPTAGPSRVVD